MEYIAKPTQIDFDDDLLYCISALIKKSKTVSPTFMIVFKYLPALHLKYKGVFGTLLQTINYYIVYGKEHFENSKEMLAVLFDMANISLFAKEPPVILSNNAEGAILYSIVL